MSTETGGKISTTTRAKEELRPELTRVLTSRELERESDAECNTIPYSGQYISSRCIESECTRARAARITPTWIHDGDSTRSPLPSLRYSLSPHKSTCAFQSHLSMLNSVPKWNGSCALPATPNGFNVGRPINFTKRISAERKRSNRLRISGRRSDRNANGSVNFLAR